MKLSFVIPSLGGVHELTKSNKKSVSFENLTSNTNVCLEVFQVDVLMLNTR